MNRVQIRRSCVVDHSNGYFRINFLNILLISSLDRQYSNMKLYLVAMAMVVYGVLALPSPNEEAANDKCDKKGYHNCVRWCPAGNAGGPDLRA